MEPSEIPEEVRSFLGEHVRSLMALELLLLVQRDRGREWTASELAKELRASPEWTEQELHDLMQRGLVASSEGLPAKFCYAPRRPELEAAVARLAEMYPQRRYSIIQIIFSAPSEPLQFFADAFKLRKEPPDG